MMVLVAGYNLAILFCASLALHLRCINYLVFQLKKRKETVAGVCSVITLSKLAESARSCGGTKFSHRAEYLVSFRSAAVRLARASLGCRATCSDVTGRNPSAGKSLPARRENTDPKQFLYGNTTSILGRFTS